MTQTQEKIEELKEQLRVINHFVAGGEIESRFRNTNEEYQDAPDPCWRVDRVYRIKPKQVELLFEWWFTRFDSRETAIAQTLRTEKNAKKTMDANYAYGKTGRTFNPETKEFGTE